MENKDLTLPKDVVSPTDVARLTRELENLDEYFRQSAIREGGEAQAAPRYSRLLDSVVVANELNLLQKDHRASLLDSLRHLSAHAPVMHISFSVDPPGPYVQKIVTWLRENIQGVILVRVGLQPNIGAGCVVRTTNKSFDFSLRRFFDNKREFFAEKLHEAVSTESQLIDEAADAEVEAQRASAKASKEADEVSVDSTSEQPQAIVTTDSEARNETAATDQEPQERIQPITEVQQS
jgi:hypothetical protein